ncbi:hypothetical protein [uncultured Flavobacterium sp.]|uniref:hypothetical protein n=1 Tax=uncultured Flavobacterium sp. TaxID=165435 RepID=UPI0030EB8794|tara:strand:+ start:12462 stop:13103 length:642 start_codon:yes stop_codon:yes gene_type:complete
MSKNNVIEMTPEKLEKLGKLADKSKKENDFDEMLSLQDKEVEIKGATINDALCTYSYELLKGPTKGDTLSRKGAHIVHDHLQEKFDNLKVFLAHIDDAFTGNTNATSLKDLEEEPETEKYYVTGFKISGVEENKSVVIVGWKEVDRGVIKFETPKEKLNGNYLYLHDLKVRVYEAISEVEQYMNGKAAPADDPNQVYMEFSEEDAAFDNAKVD